MCMMCKRGSLSDKLIPTPTLPIPTLLGCCQTSQHQTTTNHSPTGLRSIRYQQPPDRLLDT
ncbi:hypothetical protein K449DRAFT_384837 [Hypoxylon sp. EC38]|nr:hypothetical protein K449DRAFT_384837 [Hypoxylon sp. EC38]